eukprot:gene40961-50680_t
MVGATQSLPAIIMYIPPLSAFMNGVEAIKNGLDSILKQKEEFYSTRNIADRFNDQGQF